MTRDEFARRWLGAPLAPPPNPPRPSPSVRLTELSPRLFKERPPKASRLLRAAQALKQTALIVGGACGLFAAVALLLVKLAPLVADYASTYLTY